MKFLSMNNNRTLTIVLVIVIAAVVVATGWYLTKPTDNSADFKGEWKATESYIYEMEAVTV
jgi:flagellar basal body-associated protein FliL